MSESIYDVKFTAQICVVQTVVITRTLRAADAAKAIADAKDEVKNWSQKDWLCELESDTQTNYTGEPESIAVEAKLTHQFCEFCECEVPVAEYKPGQPCAPDCLEYAARLKARREVQA